MRKLFTILLFFIYVISFAQHTSPLIGAGVDKTITLPVNTTSVTGTSTLYDGATATYSWTKLRTPGMGVRRITVVGSSYSAGFGVGATEGYVYKLKEFYKSIGILDTIYNLAVSGQTHFDCDITTALNKNADVVIVYYGSNGYRVADGFTIAQICNRYRALRDSIANRGKEWFLAGTQPRDEWDVTDRARLVEINDSVRNIAGTDRFIDVDKPLRNTTGNVLKTEYQLGDGIHVNALGQTVLFDLFKAHNAFRYVAAGFDKIRTAALSTAIDSISRKGIHLYQLSAIDNFGHGGTDVMQVTATSPCGGVAYRPTPDGGDAGYGNSFALAPGDTLYLESPKQFSYVAIDGRNGTPGCPIVIMNDKGVGKLYRNQLEIRGSTYIQIRGDGTKDTYGIEISSRGRDTVTQQADGINILDRSKNIEISNLWIHNIGNGIKISQNGQCDPQFNFPNWTIDSISIHHNKITRIWNEGMYLGNTSPDNEPSGPGSYDPRPIDCGAGLIYPKPMRLGNIKVFNNFVDSTGRGGIQLATASTGISEIYNNVVKHNGMNGDDAQGTAISTGAYTRAKIYGNTISNTYTWGVAILGAMGTGVTQEVTGNTIDSSGYMQHYNLASTGLTELKLSTATVFSNNLPWPQNIFLKSTDNVNRDSTRFLIKDNVFKLKKGSFNVSMLDEYNTFHKGYGNFICNNTNVPSGAITIDVEGANAVVYSTVCAAIIKKFRFRKKV